MARTVVYVSTDLRWLAQGHAAMVRSPLIGNTHIDPTTGDVVRRITRFSARGSIYPPAVPCADCIGYPCECGTAGEGC